MSHMAVTTIRELRNRFPAVKRLVEAEGEVIVTDRGQPKYRLTLYTPPRSVSEPAAKDYVARLQRHQPDALSGTGAAALENENRGER
jgi:antitoxin (DNA-binding transcriptional repressor) of toxin-antitoxin stability system